MSQEEALLGVDSVDNVDGDVSQELKSMDTDADDSNSDEEEEVEDNVMVEPVRKRKAPAPVWQYGGLKTEAGNKCSLCGKVYRSGNSTSNLTDHIIKKHKKSPEGQKLKELRDGKRVKVNLEKTLKAKKKEKKVQFNQVSIINFTKKGAPLDAFKKKKIEEAIIELIVIENEALNLVDKHSFRKLLHVIEPSFICPSRSTIRRKIEDFAEKTKKHFVEELAKDLREVQDPTVQLTSDHGTGGDKFRSHNNVLTISRCTKDYVIKTDIVAVIHCNGSQTGEVIRSLPSHQCSLLFLSGHTKNTCVFN